MAYCPHCAYIMPSPGTRVSCPNCGRKRVRLQNRKPTIFSNTTAYESREASRGTFLSSFAAAVLIALCGLVFLAIGVVMRSPVGLLWCFLGMVGGGMAIYCFRDLTQNFSLDREPDKGYIDHLRDLEESREALRLKIGELEELGKRQHPRQSERAANRLKLVSAALKNRKLKLGLIDEVEFIIEAKRRISRIEALAQDLSAKRQQGETERRIESAFTEIKEWMKMIPGECRSVAGRKVRHSLEQAMGLHSEIMEQIEDRLVMRALNDSESGEEFALEQIYTFLDRSLLNNDLAAFDIEEAITADEEYLRITTELRLLKDGIKNDFVNDPFIDFESDTENPDYPSGLS